MVQQCYYCCCLIIKNYSTCIRHIFGRNVTLISPRPSPFFIALKMHWRNCSRIGSDYELSYIWCYYSRNYRIWFDIMLVFILLVFYAAVVDSWFSACCVRQVMATLAAGKGSHQATACRPVTRHLMTTARTTGSRRRPHRRTVRMDRRRPPRTRCLIRTPMLMPPPLLQLLLHRQSQAQVGRR